MNKEKLPTTLEESVDYYTPSFKGLEHLFENSEDNFASFCHSQLSGGIGMQIRNQLGLWDADSVMTKHMNEVYSLNHADDMSDLILREIYKKVNKKLAQ